MHGLGPQPEASSAPETWIGFAHLAVWMGSDKPREHAEEEDKVASLARVKEEDGTRQQWNSSAKFNTRLDFNGNCTRPWGGIHTPMCPGVCIVLLVSTVYSATTLCCLLFRGHHEKEAQCIIQRIRKEICARISLAGSIWAVENAMKWPTVFIDLKVCSMPCYYLMLWFSAAACCNKAWLLVLSLLWKWMNTGKIRDVSDSNTPSELATWLIWGNGWLTWGHYW